MGTVRLFMSSRRCPIIVSAVGATLLLAFSTNGLARGGYGAMRGYQRVAQQQMQAMQKQMAALEAEQKEQHDAFMKRFDTNKNGKIDGKEKAPAQKYLRQLQLGKDPDKAIMSMGRPTSSSGSSAKSSSAKSK